MLAGSEVADHDLVDTGVGQRPEPGYHLADIPDDEDLRVEPAMARLGRLIARSIIACAPRRGSV